MTTFESSLPTKSEKDDDISVQPETSSSTKRRRKAGEVGFLAVEAPKKRPEQPPANQNRYVFDVSKARETKAANPPETPPSVFAPETPKPPAFEDNLKQVAETTEPVTAEEAPLDRLSVVEKPVLVQGLAAAEQQQQHEAGTPEPAVDDFLERAQESGNIEAAYEATKAEYGLDAYIEDDETTPPTAEAEASNPDVDAESEVDEAAAELFDSEGDGEAREIPLADEVGEAEPVNPDSSPEATNHDDDPLQPPINGGGNSGSGGGGSSGPPPHTPWSPFGGNPNNGGGPGGPSGPGTGPGAGSTVSPFNRASFNTAPVASTEQLAQQPEWRGAHPATMALFGGVIGYLIGRRRGRIKAERKFKPIRRKLEHQVADLHWQIQDKENKLRKAAAAKAAQESPIETPAVVPIPLIRRSETTPDQSQPMLARPAEIPRSERQTTVSHEATPDQVRQRAPEAHQLHGTTQAREHIGSMLMAAESAAAVIASQKRTEQVAAPEQRTASKRENLQAAQQEVTLPPSSTRVETLDRAELLELSEKITIDGNSLRQIYETHLIGERGLRRLVAEYLRGGDIRKALKREVVEREIDFERDPAMRDKAVNTISGGGAAQSSPKTLDEMIKRAASQVDGSEETMFYKAKADYQEQQHAEALKQRRMLDIGIMTAISLLLGTVIFIIISRMG